MKRTGKGRKANSPGHANVTRVKMMPLQVRRPHFDAIKSGRKRWEGRPFCELRKQSGQWVQWRFGHLATVDRTIFFQSGLSVLRVRILEVRRYLPGISPVTSPVRAMLRDLGADLLPDADDSEARVNVYHNLYGEEQCARGFVAMRLQLPQALVR